jgi:hypothetical protein
MVVHHADQRVERGSFRQEIFGADCRQQRMIGGVVAIAREPGSAIEVQLRQDEVSRRAERYGASQCVWLWWLSD